MSGRAEKIGETIGSILVMGVRYFPFIFLAGFIWVRYDPATSVAVICVLAIFEGFLKESRK